MARLDGRLLQNVVDSRTPDLGLVRVEPELIRRQAMHEEALESQRRGGTRPPEMDGRAFSGRCVVLSPADLSHRNTHPA
jgi:hypothetical protein